jgi:hypothetical protein
VCDSLSERFYPYLSLYDIQLGELRPDNRLNLLKSKRDRRMALTFQSEDILRMYIHDIRVSGFSSRNGLLSVILPLQIKKIRQWTMLQVSRPTFDYDGRSTGQGWAGQLSTSGFASRLEYGVEIGRHRLGASVSGSQLRGRNQAFTIGKFPHSQTDSRMNRFFLDLLEPTFSHNVTYDLQDRSWDVETGGILALSARSRLGMTVRLQNREIGGEAHTTNSGTKTELQGVRLTDLTFVVASRRFIISAEHRFRRRWRVLTEAGHTTDRLQLDLRPRDVPVSEDGVTLDFTELGNGSGSRRSVDLKVTNTWIKSESFQLSGLMGWGRSTYRSDATGTTPVLGFRFGAIPISHSGAVKTSGTITSWVTAAHTSKRWRRFGLIAGAMVARAGVTTETRADANLEFGLIDRSVRVVSHSGMTLLRFYVAPSVSVAKVLRVRYRATQHAALVEGEKIRVEGGRFRGGSVHVLTLMFHY